MKKENELLLWLAAIVVLMLAASCEDTKQADAKRSVVLTSPMPIATTTAKSYAGVVEEAHTVSLSFKVAGQISKVYTKEGDHVCRGQLIATLDDADYRLSVEALQIQCDQTREEVERMAELFRQKSVSANDYEKALAGVRQLEVQLQSSKNQLAYTRLYALTDGYIQSVNFTTSETVGAGMCVASLLDLSQMEVVCSVENGTCGVANEYYCRISGIDEMIPLRYVSTTPKADNNQLCQLRLAFKGKTDSRIVAGMNAEVIVSRKSQDAGSGFTIPLTAIFEDSNGKPSVWIMKADSTLAKRNVILSPKVLDGMAIVNNGINANERIVSSGANTLQEGERVTVVEKPSKTNVGGLL